MWGCYCIVNKVVQGAMCVQIAAFTGCLIKTQLWSAEADHKIGQSFVRLDNVDIRHINVFSQCFFYNYQIFGLIPN